MTWKQMRFSLIDYFFNPWNSYTLIHMGRAVGTPLHVPAIRSDSLAPQGESDFADGYARFGLALDGDGFEALAQDFTRLADDYECFGVGGTHELGHDWDLLLP